MTRPYRFLSTTGNSYSSSSSDQTAAQPPEAIAVESDFVVILAALLCALICVLGLIAVARCAWLRRSSTPTSTTRRNPNRPTANKGMKKKVVESLPKFVYTSDNNINNKQQVGDEKNDKNEKNCWNIMSSGECAICLSEYINGDEIRVLPQCGHNFHVGCIDTWLSSHSSCPSCRQMLVMTRCRKCGEFPVVSAGEGSSETVRKGRQHDNSSCSSDYLP